MRLREFDKKCKRLESQEKVFLEKLNNTKTMESKAYDTLKKWLTNSIKSQKRRLAIVSFEQNYYIEKE